MANHTLAATPISSLLAVAGDKHALVNPGRQVMWAYCRDYSWFTKVAKQDAWPEKLGWCLLLDMS